MEAARGSQAPKPCPLVLLHGSHPWRAILPELQQPPLQRPQELSRSFCQLYPDQELENRKPGNKVELLSILNYGLINTRDK